MELRFLPCGGTARAHPTWSGLVILYSQRLWYYHDDNKYPVLPSRGLRQRTAPIIHATRLAGCAPTGLSHHAACVSLCQCVTRSQHRWVASPATRPRTAGLLDAIRCLTHHSRTSTSCVGEYVLRVTAKEHVAEPLTSAGCLARFEKGREPTLGEVHLVDRIKCGIERFHLGGAEAPGAQLPFGGVLVVATRGCGAAVENTTLVGVVSASRLMIQAERAKRASLLEALSE